MSHDHRPVRMTEYGKCVVRVLERIGMHGASERYVAEVEALDQAARAWFQLGPEAQRGGFLAFDLPDLLSGTIVTGNLSEAAAAGWCRNEAAKAFVKWIDERTGKTATLLMLQIILLLQQAMTTKNVNAAGGAG